MKLMKKISALVIAMVMVLAMALPAMAQDQTPAATTKTVTLTGGKAGHTYTLYQIFTGTVDAETGELQNIQWGADAPAAYKQQYDTAASAAKAVGEQNDARAFAQSLALTGGTPQTLSADGTVTFAGLAEGYYIVVDANNNENAVEGDYSSAVIVQVVNNVDMKLKGSGATSEKKVADNNDTSKIQPDLSDLQNVDWQDSADYDIGDAVPFKLKATTADNVAAYTKYHITFQDKQSAGLAAPQNMYVEVLGKTLTVGDTATTASTEKTKITVEKVTPDEERTFAVKVTFEQVEPTTDDGGNITSYLDAECNSIDVVVKYTSQLTGSGVVIGKDGNPNDMYIKYSNNPEDKDDKDEGKTKDDRVIVFTYKTVVDKVDETGAALKGAGFTLYKEVPQGTTGAKLGSEITFGEKVEHSAIATDKYYVVVGTMTADASGATFGFDGIDDGTYVLVETTIPDGYNPWQSAVVKVDATHTDGDAPELTELTASSTFTANVDTGEITKKDGSKHSAASGELYAEIENNSGATLPSTGGIGTTIFYVIGGILVVLAAVVLVTRRKAAK